VLPDIPLHDWATTVAETFGYPGVVLLVMVEVIFPPIPSEVVLPLYGFMSAQGDFNVVLVCILATVGSVLGSLFLYGVGYWFSMPRLRDLVQRYGRYALVQESDLDRAYDWFARHGAMAVVIGRLVPGIRSLISIPAGLQRMPVGQFILYTAIGSGIWNVFLVSLGWILGDQWDRVGKYLDYFEYAVILAVLAVAAWFVWTRRARLRDMLRA
jgi:membrane protein DedA with SNARE-associated domain